MTKSEREMLKVRSILSIKKDHVRTNTYWLPNLIFMNKAKAYFARKI